MPRRGGRPATGVSVTATPTTRTAARIIARVHGHSKDNRIRMLSCGLECSGAAGHSFATAVVEPVLLRAQAGATPGNGEPWPVYPPGYNASCGAQASDTLSKWGGESSQTADTVADTVVVVDAWADPLGLQAARALRPSGARPPSTTSRRATPATTPTRASARSCRAARCSTRGAEGSAARRRSRPREASTSRTRTPCRIFCLLCCVVLLPERLRSDMVIFGRIYCEFDDPEQFKEYYVRPHSAPLALLHLCCCFCAAAYC